VVCRVHARPADIPAARSARQLLDTPERSRLRYGYPVAPGLFGVPPAVIAVEPYQLSGLERALGTIVGARDEGHHADRTAEDHDCSESCRERGFHRFRVVLVQRKSGGRSTADLASRISRS
jgi:hypothetical protein